MQRDSIQRWVYIPKQCFIVKTWYINAPISFSIKINIPRTVIIRLQHDTLSAFPHFEICGCPFELPILPSFISELMLTLIFSMSQSSAGLKETHIAAESNTGTETKANFQQYYFESLTKFDYPRCSSKAWILSVGNIFLNSCLALCFTFSLAVSNITTTNCSLQIKKHVSDSVWDENQCLETDAKPWLSPNSQMA